MTLKVELSGPPAGAFVAGGGDQHILGGAAWPPRFLKNTQGVMTQTVGITYDPHYGLTWHPLNQVRPKSAPANRDLGLTWHLLSANYCLLFIYYSLFYRGNVIFLNAVIHFIFSFFPYYICPINSPYFPYVFLIGGGY